MRIWIRAVADLENNCLGGPFAQDSRYSTVTSSDFSLSCPFFWCWIPSYYYFFLRGARSRCPPPLGSATATEVTPMLSSSHNIVRSLKCFRQGRCDLVPGGLSGPYRCQTSDYSGSPRSSRVSAAAWTWDDRLRKSFVMPLVKGWQGSLGLVSQRVM